MVVAVVAVTALAGVVAAYGCELGRIASFLQGRDVHSNARVALGLPLPGLASLVRAVNAQLDATDAERQQRRLADRRFQRDLGALSHDIRTPLAGAKGYVQLSVDEADDGQRDGYVASAIVRLDDVESLLNQLFAYTQSADPDAQLECAPVAVLPVLAEVLASHVPAFEERGWQPEVTFADEGLIVQADRAALARIFENLVTNALRYGVAAPVIRQEGRRLTMANEVADPASIDATRLFERFYRAEPARTSAGAGLGLAVVDNLSRAMSMQPQAWLSGNVLSVAIDFSAQAEPAAETAGDAGDKGLATR